MKLQYTWPTQLLVCLLAIGCSGRASQPTGFETPQAAFDALLKAFREEDMRGMVRCVTPYVSDRMVGDVVLIEGRRVKRMQERNQTPELAQKLLAVLEKYGVGPAVLDAKLPPEAMARAKIEQREAAAGALATDKGALFAELYEIKKAENGRVDLPPPDAALADLTITGDKALGKITGGGDAGQGGMTITFQKTASGWLISSFGEIAPPNMVELPMERDGSIVPAQPETSPVVQERPHLPADGDKEP